jgi:hypothetical protein
LTGKSAGEYFYANVAVENEEGVISIYNPVEILLLNPEIVFFELTSDTDPIISADEDFQITYDIEGNDGIDETVLFNSLNTDIVTVDSNGLIAAVGVEGKTTVEAYPEQEPSNKKTITVTVYEEEFASENNEFTITA